MATDWNMPRRTEACAACHRTFDIGEWFHAFLYQAGEGYERRDYCMTCVPPAEPPAVGDWKTRRPEPAAKRLQPFDREAVYGFFQRLEETADEGRAQFRFVLALLLWRKKILRLERTSDDAGAEVWEYAAARTGQPHRVPRPALDEGQLERLSEQLEQLLAGGTTELDTVAPELNAEDKHG